MSNETASPLAPFYPTGPVAVVTKVTSGNLFSCSSVQSSVREEGPTRPPSETHTMKPSLLALAAVIALALPATAAETAVDKAPPPAPFQKVSKLVKLPDFIPGIGDLYVDPATIPAGPFLAYDHDGKIVSTIYM